MKSKLFSVIALIVAVLFVGAFQQVQANDTSEAVTLTQLMDDFDRLSDQAIEKADLMVGSDIQSIFKETKQSAAGFVPSFEADRDHQVISLYVGERLRGYHNVRFRCYLPRSNIQ